MGAGSDDRLRAGGLYRSAGAVDEHAMLECLGVESVQLCIVEVAAPLEDKRSPVRHAALPSSQA